MRLKPNKYDPDLGFIDIGSDGDCWDSFMEIDILSKKESQPESKDVRLMEVKGYKAGRSGSRQDSGRSGVLRVAKKDAKNKANSG
jgi:hypothetical protein